MSFIRSKAAFTFFVAVILSCGAVAFAGASSSASSASPDQGQVPMTVTVTALGSNFSSPPPIAQEDLSAYSGQTRLAVTRWVRAQADNGNLQLAILVDENLGSAMVGRQMEDLADFIRSQPSSTSVGVFYAQNGAANAATEGFTTNHDAAAKSLHITAGRAGDSPSIYLSVSDLVSHWTAPANNPANNNVRRELLVIASGFDPLNPGLEDPYADAAIHAAEKSGVDVHTILVPNPRYAQTFASNISEGKVIELVSGTGGQTLFDGNYSPISFQPYLKNLSATLDNQYLLTFNIDASKKKGGELRPLRVQTEEHGVKLYAPQQIFVPAS
jgi:hypothetical protein